MIIYLKGLMKNIKINMVYILVEFKVLFVIMIKK